MIVVGEKEQEGRQVSVRQQGGHDLGAMGLQEFAEKLLDETKI